MIAAWLEDGRLSFRDDRPEPTGGAGEALIRVTAAGICATDLAMLGGYRPFTGIPGHEFAGVVEQGPPEWVGARVVGEINITCAGHAARNPADAPASVVGVGAGEGPCPACRAGRSTHCERRTAIGIFGRDGAFAQRLALPVGNLHRLPAEICDEAAVFVEPLAAAFRILEQVEVAPSTRALVVGPGRLGQLVARVLRTMGCAPIVTGRSAPGLTRLSTLGFEAVRAGEIDHGAFDIAVDCTGHPSGFGTARAALRAGGTLVLKSTYPERVEIDASSLVVDEIRLLGSRCGPFPVAIEALAHGTVEVLDLIDDRFPLAEVVAAYDRAAQPGVAKVLLTP